MPKYNHTRAGLVAVFDIGVAGLVYGGVDGSAKNIYESVIHGSDPGWEGDLYLVLIVAMLVTIGVAARAYFRAEVKDLDSVDISYPSSKHVVYTEKQANVTSDSTNTYTGESATVKDPVVMQIRQTASARNKLEREREEQEEQEAAQAYCEQLMDDDSDSAYPTFY